MTEASASVGRTHLSVRNFGPIAEAEVELRPLTIFLGPSNTGKSYLAMLIHAISRYLSTSSYLDIVESSQPTIAATGSTGSRELTEASTDSANQSPVPSTGGDSETDQQLDQSVAELSADFKRRLKKVADLVADSNSSVWRIEDIAEALREYFGIVDATSLRRHRASAPTQVVVRREDEVEGELANFAFSLDPTNTPATLQMAPKFLEAHAELLGQFQRGNLEAGGDAEWSDFSLAIWKLVKALAHEEAVRRNPPFGLLEQGSRYLSAGRTGIVDAYRTVISSLVQQAANGESRREDPMPRMSRILSEYFLNLLNKGDEVSPYADLADEIEVEILGGRIQEELIDGVGYPELFYIPESWEGEKRIPLTEASSMITELAPIVMYLRHVVKENELLIIEEPEAHLHPAMQARLAIQLAKLVKRGGRVLITTHSEWLLEQFSNLVRIGNLSEEQRTQVEGRHKLLSGAALPGSDVGVWTFDPPTATAGSTVNRFDLGYGPERIPEQYKDVMLRMYDEWQDVERYLTLKAA